MARLQILELPTEHHGDDMVTPWILVIDQVSEDVRAEITHWPDNISTRLGARQVLCFSETVDIPANSTLHEGERADTSPEDAHTHALETKLNEVAEGAARLYAQLDEARQWARHGYEIGQMHCGWADHGVAPAWLTEGWPPHFDSCEHLKRAAEYDEALTRVRNLPTEPEVMNAQQEHPSVWGHGYHCGVLAAKEAARPRREPAQAVEDGG